MSVPAATATLRLHATKPPVHKQLRDKSCNRLVIVLPGAMASKILPGKECLEVCDEHGDVVQVWYDLEKGFDSNKAVEELFSFVKMSNYTDIVILGMSMGGLIGYDLIQLLKLRGIRKSQRLFLGLWDAPSSGKDLHQQFLPRVAQWLPMFPTPEWLNRRFLAGPTPQMEVGIDIVTRERHMRETHSLPLLGVAQQGAYIWKHPELRSWVLQGVGMAFMQTPKGKDIIVRYEAYDGWNKVYDDKLPRIIIDGCEHHCGPIEFPKACSAALRRLFEAMGLQSIRRNVA